MTGFRDWFQPVPEPAEGRFFARERSGYGLLVAGVGVATAVEIVPVHLLLSHFWTPIAGWIATGLGASTAAVWIVGDWQAVRRMPTELADDALKMRVGLRWRVDVPYGIDRVGAPGGVVGGEGRGRAPGVSGGSAERTAWSCARRSTAVGPYGIRKEVERIALLVDEPARFETAVRERYWSRHEEGALAGQRVGSPGRLTSFHLPPASEPGGQ